MLEGRRLLTLSFPTTESYPVDANPSAFVVGDFNNDGLPDVATATTFGTVDILLDHAGANFSAGTTLQLSTGDSATGIQAADIEGKGYLDLVVPYASNGTTVTTGLLIFKGNGDGTFQAPMSIPTTDPISFTVGDLNGDGKPDIAIMESSGLNILLNKGDGTLEAPAVYPAFSTGNSANALLPLSQQLAVGDFSGDGKADLAVSAKDASSNPIVAIYQNAGNGTFDNPFAASGVAGARLISALAFAGNGTPPQPADLNGDTHTDLVEITASGMLGVSLNDGNGGFSSTTSYSAVSPRGLAVADFNGDGKQDIAVVENNHVSIYANNGDGTLSTPTDFSLPPADTEPVEVVVADFDGDGKPDLAVLNETALSYQVSLLLSAPARPRLAPIADLNVPYGDIVQFAAAGSDLDPTQTLTYSVSSGTIDLKTGVYTSEPVTLGMTDLSVTISVSDSNSPPHTASQSFTIHPLYTNPVIVVNNHIYYGYLARFLDISVPAGQPMTLTGYVADSVADQPLAADINLNDFVSTGVGVQRLPLNPDGSFSLSHTYGTPRSFQVLFTVTDGAGHKTSAFINVTVTGSATGVGGTGAAVQVSSILEKVVKRAISEFDVQFDSSVTGASNPANYHLAIVTRKKVRKHIVTVTKPIVVKSVSYDSVHDVARVIPAGNFAPGKINQMTITASGILDSLGRPLDGNHDGQPGGNLVADVGKRTVSIR